MLYDAKIEAECDSCQETIEIELDYVYTDYSGNNGHYDDTNVDEKLENEHQWGVDGDKHYCSGCK